MTENVMCFGGWLLTPGIIWTRKHFWVDKQTVAEKLGFSARLNAFHLLITAKTVLKHIIKPYLSIEYWIVPQSKSALHALRYLINGKL